MNRQVMVQILLELFIRGSQMQALVGMSRRSSKWESMVEHSFYACLPGFAQAFLCNVRKRPIRQPIHLLHAIGRAYGSREIDTRSSYDPVLPVHVESHRIQGWNGVASVTWMKCLEMLGGSWRFGHSMAQLSKLPWSHQSEATPD